MYNTIEAYKEAKKFKRSYGAKVKGCRVAVTLDWLSVIFIDNGGRIPEPEDGGVYQVTDTITLVYTGKGNEHYKYIYNVHYRGEHLASIVCHTRNEKFVRKGVVKVDFKNHLLYTDGLWNFYDELVGVFSLEYKNIARVDIAMDGMGHLIALMNRYVKQDRESKFLEMKGRPRFDSKLLDRKTMLYQNFHVGATAASKRITIYNKSLEIVRSGKDYIQDFWKLNGMTGEKMDLKALEKEITDDTTELQGRENVYRFEMRLKGEAVKEIENFSMELLQTPAGLVSILKLMTRGFFEFVMLTDSCLTRCEAVDVIPFDRFEIIPLKKAVRRERDDLYKTKLSIKKNVRQLYTGKLDPEDLMVKQMLHFDIDNFRLYEWFRKKMVREWHVEFSLLTADEEHVRRTDSLILSVIQANEDKAAELRTGEATETESFDKFLRTRFRKQNPRTATFIRELVRLTARDVDDLFG